jgi:hypothetical protein
MVQLRLDCAGRDYYQRRRAAGDSGASAVRCLKRRLCRVVFNRMRADYARRPSLDAGGPCHQAGRLLSLTRVTPVRPPGHGPGAATAAHTRTPARLSPRRRPVARGDSPYLHPRGTAACGSPPAVISLRGAPTNRPGSWPVIRGALTAPIPSQGTRRKPKPSDLLTRPRPPPPWWTGPFFSPDSWRNLPKFRASSSRFPSQV